MPETILTATTYRKTKNAPLKVALGNDTKYGARPNVFRDVLRNREWEDDWSPPDGWHFRSAQLAIPARTGYDNLSEDFTYAVVRSIDEPQVARHLAAVFLRTAEKLEIPYQHCRGCAHAHPAPCFNCIMADAADFDRPEV